MEKSEYVIYTSYGSHRTCAKKAIKLNKQVNRKRLGYSHCEITPVDDIHVGYRFGEVTKDRGINEKYEPVHVIDGTTLKEMKEDGVYELKVYYTRIKNASK